MEKGVAHTPFGALEVEWSGSAISRASFHSGADMRPGGDSAVADARAAGAVGVFLGGGRAEVAPGGTDFQKRVWQAVCRIPFGATATYAEIAAAVGVPRGARAVARAVACNPAALFIPCHRVVPARGGTGGYRWGRQRKAAILSHEARAAKGEGRFFGNFAATN